MNTEDSSFKFEGFFLDQGGRSYKFLNLVEGCCHFPYYLLEEVGTNNTHAYNKNGDRLDYNLNIINDSSFKIIF